VPLEGGIVLVIFPRRLGGGVGIQPWSFGKNLVA